MSHVIDELRTFHAFVAQKLDNGGATLTPEEALDQWRMSHPDPEDFENSVAAVRKALSDMAAGDQGRPVVGFVADLRIRHKLPSR